MTTAFGRDINEFYNNRFPQGLYIEDYTDTYDEWLEQYGDEDCDLWLPDDEEFDLAAFGNVYSCTRRKVIDTFESLFLTWLSQQATTKITIEVPRNLYDELRKHLDDLGCKIVR